MQHAFEHITHEQTNTSRLRLRKKKIRLDWLVALVHISRANRWDQSTGKKRKKKQNYDIIGWMRTIVMLHVQNVL